MPRSFAPVLRWLIATLLALLGFIAVILALGYLLKSNEQQVTEFSEQLAEQAQQQQTSVPVKANQISHAERALVKAQLDQQVLLRKAQEAEQELIVANLTCRDHSQCRAVSLKFIEADNCAVAVNFIGASQLKKLVDLTSPGQIPTNSSCAQLSKVKASCLDNLCQLLSNE